MLLLLTLSILLLLGIVQTSLTLLSLNRKIRLLADFSFLLSDFSFNNIYIRYISLSPSIIAPFAPFLSNFLDFFLCNPLPVHGIILPLHSQNGNDLLHDWRKRRCAIKERVL